MERTEKASVFSEPKEVAGNEELGVSAAIGTEPDHGELNCGLEVREQREQSPGCVCK